MPLTQKQTAALKAVPAAQRAKLRENFLRDNSNRAPPMKPAPKSAPKPRQPAQAMARTTRNRTPIPRQLAWAFDAFDKRHLPLDEVTAPYTTSNFLSFIEFQSSPTIDQILVVCPRTLTAYPQSNVLGTWTDFIAVLYNGAEVIDNNISVIDFVRSPIIDIPELHATATGQTSVRARLHNLSVKVECLGTNTGLYPPGSCYIGSVPYIENGLAATPGIEGLTAEMAWANDNIAVGYLRSFSAASLVTKPQMLHAAIAETISYKTWRDFEVPTAGSSVGNMGFSTSLEPILVYVPRVGAGDTRVSYRVNIAQQWCSRHPHNIMLRSTQTQHPATSPDIWHAAINGVKDIGEHVLERAGHAAFGMLRDSAMSYVGSFGAGSTAMVPYG